jgi:hypothetical protein
VNGIFELIGAHPKAALIIFIAVLVLAVVGWAWPKGGRGVHRR